MELISEFFFPPLFFVFSSFLCFLFFSFPSLSFFSFSLFSFLSFISFFPFLFFSFLFSFASFLLTCGGLGQMDGVRANTECLNSPEWNRKQVYGPGETYNWESSWTFGLL